MKTLLTFSLLFCSISLFSQSAEIYHNSITLAFDTATYEQVCMITVESVHEKQKIEPFLKYINPKYKYTWILFVNDEENGTFYGILQIKKPLYK